MMEIWGSLFVNLAFGEVLKQLFSNDFEGRILYMANARTEQSNNLFLH